MRERGFTLTSSLKVVRNTELTRMNGAHHNVRQFNNATTSQYFIHPIVGIPFSGNAFWR
jgi:hypothetical protein